MVGPGERSHSTTTWVFPPVAQSTGAARSFVAERLKRWAPDGDVALAVLLTSEIVANVVEHARTNCRVVMTVSDGTVRVEVHDGAAVTEAFRALFAGLPGVVPVGARSGRGLMIVGRSATRFGLEPTRTGKMIWFELDHVM